MFNNAALIKSSKVILNTAIPVEAFCESVNSTTYITIPDSYIGYSIINRGLTTFTLVDNRIEFTDIGAAYNIEFWNGNTLIDVLPLCEAPRTVVGATFIPEMRSRWSGLGVRMSIVNSQGYTTHDNQDNMYTHKYAFCRVSTTDYIIDVPNLNTGNIQTFLI